jgi:HK97 family phage major capsid protein
VGDCEFDELIFDAHKLGVLTKLTNELIEDSPYDVEALVRDLFIIKMKRKEEDAFFRGDGKHKPLGIIHQAQVGVTTENVGTITFDDVIDLYYSLKVPYRENAVWLMSEEACSELKKFKTHSGFYLWDKSTGKPDLFLGKPVYTTTQLGLIESGSKPILFGDFSYFWIAERGKRNIKRLSEKYADEGMIGYLTFQRVDAKLVIPEAVKSLEIK